MHIRLTHRLLAGPGPRLPDALATALNPPGRRYFVPGWLPCGECGPCRRGWLSACRRGQSLASDAQSTPIDLAERFLCPLDEAPGSPALDESIAICAGIVAELQEACARAGLGSGDVAVWIGDGVRCRLGARLSAGRCSTFRLGDAASGSSGAGVAALAPTDGPPSWRAALEDAASAAPGGFQERRLFIDKSDPELVERAMALVVPGTTLTFLDGTGSATLSPAALASCRVLVSAERGYHPDLVPEALATLRRDSDLVRDLLVEGNSAEGRDDRRLTLLRV